MSIESGYLYILCSIGCPSISGKIFDFWINRNSVCKALVNRQDWSYLCFWFSNLWKGRSFCLSRCNIVSLFWWIEKWIELFAGNFNKLFPSFIQILVKIYYDVIFVVCIKLENRLEALSIGVSLNSLVLIDFVFGDPPHETFFELTACWVFYEARVEPDSLWFILVDINWNQSFVLMNLFWGRQRSFSQIIFKNASAQGSEIGTLP